VAGDDRRLKLIRTGALAQGGSGEEPDRFGDGLPVPSGPVLVLEQDDLAIGAEAGGRPGAVQPDQGEQPGDLWLSGH
jgi:hypothetical protein